MHAETLNGTEPWSMLLITGAFSFSVKTSTVK